MRCLPALSLISQLLGALKVIWVLSNSNQKKEMPAINTFCSYTKALKRPLNPFMVPFEKLERNVFGKSRPWAGQPEDRGPESLSQGCTFTHSSGSAGPPVDGRGYVNKIDSEARKLSNPFTNVEDFALLFLPHHFKTLLCFKGNSIHLFLLLQNAVVL